MAGKEPRFLQKLVIQFKYCKIGFCVVIGMNSLGLAYPKSVKGDPCKIRNRGRVFETGREKFFFLVFFEPQRQIREYILCFFNYMTTGKSAG